MSKWDEVEADRHDVINTPSIIHNVRAKDIEYIENYRERMLDAVKEEK